MLPTFARRFSLLIEHLKKNQNAPLHQGEDLQNNQTKQFYMGQ